MITWGGVIFLTGFGVLFSCIIYFGKSSSFVFVSPSIIWVIIFLFLVDALRRIKIVMKSLTDAVLIFKAFLFYAITSFIVIVGQIP